MNLESVLNIKFDECKSIHDFVKLLKKDGFVIFKKHDKSIIRHQDRMILNLRTDIWNVFTRRVKHNDY